MNSQGITSFDLRGIEASTRVDRVFSEIFLNRYGGECQLLGVDSSDLRLYKVPIAEISGQAFEGMPECMRVSSSGEFRDSLKDCRAFYFAEYSNIDFFSTWCSLCGNTLYMFCKWKEMSCYAKLESCLEVGKCLGDGEGLLDYIFVIRETPSGKEISQLICCKYSGLYGPIPEFLQNSVSVNGSGFAVFQNRMRFDKVTICYLTQGQEQPVVNLEAIRDFGYVWYHCQSKPCGQWKTAKGAARALGVEVGNGEIALVIYREMWCFR